VTQTPLGRHLAPSLAVGAFAAAAVVAVTQRSAIADAIAQCTRLDPAALLAAATLTAAGVVNRGLQTRRAYAGAGLAIGVRGATAITAAAYCGNKLTKTGGLIGLFAHLHDARRRALDPTRTVAAYVVITLSGAAGAFVMAASVVALAGLPWFVALLSGCAMVAAAGPRVRSRSIATSFLARRARRVADRFASVDVDEVGQACRSIARAREHVALVVVHAVLGKLLGAVTLYVVLHGLGVTGLGAEATVRLYALALVAAALGPFPGGMGTTEASLTALLVAAHVDPGTALAAALAFRLFDLWLPVAVGAAVAPFVLRPRRETSAGAPAPAHRRELVDVID
jgi:uncharacterized membrane protein YbhN (UPF0104 family)